MILTMEVAQPASIRAPGCQVLALAAYAQVPFTYRVLFSNAFRYKTPPSFTIQPQQSTNITLHHSPHTFNLFIWSDRWTAPTSLQYLPPPPPLHPCRQYPTLSQPTSLLNRSLNHDFSVVQNSFNSPTGSQPWKGMMAYFHHTPGLFLEQSIREKIFYSFEVSNQDFGSGTS